ncbi:MAG: sulfatase [Pirellulaceae bacterium]|nr:sulfatase [Pirellulaceae bacterium]
MRLTCSLVPTLCLSLSIVLVSLSTARAQSTLTASASRPNILWITSEDNGPQLGCYGDSYATTPNIDRLAAKGMMYTNCWSNAPVCAPARTTIVSGMYPTSLSAQHMRSQVDLPRGVKLYPQIFRELGYYCTNNSKEDYNLTTGKDLWNDSSNNAHWRKRKAGQPFFAVFNFTTSHESQIRKRPHAASHDPLKVSVPPYHPDTPEVREDWAQYYDKISEMDQQVGQVLEQLKQDGLEESTIVFYYGDHGSGMPRSKRWLYQSGLLVPMIVHVPARFQQAAGKEYTANSKNERLISFVDLVPTVMSLVGERPAENLQGHAFLGTYVAEAPKYIYGFRDRMDERIDMSRAVRDDRYLYIRNFHPQRPQGAYLDYMFQTPTTRVWKQMFDEGKLNAVQSVFWKPKVAEELYDLKDDPYQIKNLASDPTQLETLQRMRGAVKSWMIDVCDLGLLPEGEVFERAGRDAPYTFGHDPKLFPVSSIYDAADLATRVEEGDLPKLLANRVAGDSAARFWTACGMLYRAQQGPQRDEIVKAARGMVTDPSAYVRCIANEITARFGTETDRAVSIQSLLKLANAKETNAFVAMMALNSLLSCEPTAAEIGDKAKTLPDKVTGLKARYDSYLPRLIERLAETAK